MSNSKNELINISKTNKQYKNTSRLMNFFNLGVTTKGNMIPTEYVRDKKGNETDKIKAI